MWLSAVGGGFIDEKMILNKLKFAEIQDFGSFLLPQTGQVAPEPAEGPEPAIKF